MDNRFIRFAPDYWRIGFNFEAIASVTTTATDELTVTGHYRTYGDYIALVYTAEESWNHSYAAYPTDPNFERTKLEFTLGYEGAVQRLDDPELQPSLVVTDYHENDWFATLGYLRPSIEASSTFEFDGEIALNHTWIIPESQTLRWKDTAGSWHTAEFGVDYDMDFVRGKLFTTLGNVETYATCELSYKAAHGDKYVLDFSDLYQGTHPNAEHQVPTAEDGEVTVTGLQRIPTASVQRISIPLLPTFYERGQKVATGRSDLFRVKLSQMVIEGGDLGSKPAPRKKLPYSVCEGYDDEYDKNPARLAESMATLGYSGKSNFYIGASHYYEKHAPNGQPIYDHLSMFIDPGRGCNEAYKSWLRGYIRGLKEHGFDGIIISVAMENLQCPPEWKQLMSDLMPGQTGWVPATSFYDPNVQAARDYISKISRENLDLVVEGGLRPILQLGESWWWWQEFAPGDVTTPYPGRPPCFYNYATKLRHLNDLGRYLPDWGDSSAIEKTPENEETAWWLRKCLGEFTDNLSLVAKEYEDSQFTTLFFPPSVIDQARVPWILQITNSPFEHWEYPKLDFIQIEDYDWVTEGNPEHEKVFDVAWSEMGFTYAKQHYFAGFVLRAEQADEHWPLIERSAQQALGKGFAEIFIWAGTQIRRDDWNPSHNALISTGSRRPWGHRGVPTVEILA